MSSPKQIVSSHDQDGLDLCSLSIRDGSLKLMI